MGNGYVSRTSRRIVETVRERVSTDVVEMLPVRGGGVVGGSPGDGEWLSRQLAAEVHNKFEDMVRRSPNPTRAERTSYEELVAGFPARGEGGGGRLALPGANTNADSGRSPRGDAAAAGFGSPPGLQTEPNRTDRTNHTAATRAQNDSDLFTNLSSPPPSFRDANGGASGGANDGGVSLDDLILRRRGPPPDPDELRGTSGNFGRGFGRGSPLGGGAIFSPPTSAGRDAERARRLPRWKNSRRRRRRRARAAAVAAGGGRGGGGRGGGAARPPRRLGDSDSDDDGNKIGAVRAGIAKPEAAEPRGGEAGPPRGAVALRARRVEARRRRGQKQNRRRRFRRGEAARAGIGEWGFRGGGFRRARWSRGRARPGTRAGAVAPSEQFRAPAETPGGVLDRRRIGGVCVGGGDPGDRRGGTATARGPVEGRSGAFEHSGEGEGRVGAANAAHGGGRVGHGGRLG